MEFTFGDHAPCRACDGDGKRRGALSTEERRARNRILRIAGRRGEPSPVLDVRCRRCGGAGYLPRSEADRRQSAGEWE